MPAQIAQVNIALPLELIDSPLLAGFVELLDPINQLAGAASGFVWCLQDDAGNATAPDHGFLLGSDHRNSPPPADRQHVGLESVDELADLVYRSSHVGVMRRRREWFERVKIYMALWWVPSGHIPTVDEAEQRLAHLRAHGPTPYAFTFGKRFGPGHGAIAGHPRDLGCPV